jgi:hypothetical protein
VSRSADAICRVPVEYSVPKASGRFDRAGFARFSTVVSVM